MTELLSGDLCIAGSAQFADYRAQLIPWEDYTDAVAAYGTHMGLPMDSTAFVQQMRTELADLAATVECPLPPTPPCGLSMGSPCYAA